MKDPRALEEARLSFFSLANIAKALFFEERDVHIWDAIFALNALRNAFAHKLEPPQREQHLRRLGTAMASGNPKSVEQYVARPGPLLAERIALLYGYLTAMAER